MTNVWQPDNYDNIKTQLILELQTVSAVLAAAAAVVALTTSANLMRIQASVERLKCFMHSREYFCIGFGKNWKCFQMLLT